MFDPRRYLGTFAVFSLVLLRLVIGWHFLGEGLDKIEYDRHDGQVRMDFSAEPFLKQAKGPLAPWYHAQVPEGHGWQRSLATPRQNKQLTADVKAEQVKWVTDYKKRREDAAKKGEAVPYEFDPSLPYHEWANQLANDWRATVDEFKASVKLTEEQAKQADSVLEARLQELSDYLAEKGEAIAEYRHQLWRLQNWRSSPEAGQVPFVEERIAAKAGETAGTPSAWVQDVRAIESQFHRDLREILTEEQRDETAAASAIDDALSDPREDRLRTINIVVTVVTIAVGVCLLLGLFTRLASLVGALFLLGVIASQPPWIYDAAPTMPQIIEFTALLVLAGAGAGRWLGLDFFSYALFHRSRGREETT